MLPCDLTSTQKCSDTSPPDRRCAGSIPRSASASGFDLWDRPDESSAPQSLAAEVWCSGLEVRGPFAFTSLDENILASARRIRHLRAKLCAILPAVENLFTQSVRLAPLEVDYETNSDSQHSNLRVAGERHLRIWRYCTPKSH